MVLANTSKRDISVRVSGVPNLYMVDSDLYRSGHPKFNGYESLFVEGFNTIIDLCNEWECSKRLAYHDSPFFNHFEYHNVPCNGMLDKLNAPKLRRIVNLIQSAPRPTLIHCLLGKDRTGMVIASYRIMVNGWSPEAALADMWSGPYGWSDLIQPKEALSRLSALATQKL